MCGGSSVLQFCKDAIVLLNFRHDAFNFRGGLWRRVRPRGRNAARSEWWRQLQLQLLATDCL